MPSYMQQNKAGTYLNQARKTRHKLSLEIHDINDIRGRSRVSAANYLGVYLGTYLTLLWTERFLYTPTREATCKVLPILGTGRTLGTPGVIYG